MVSLIRKFYVGTPGGGGGVSAPPTMTPSPSKTPSISRTPSLTPTISITPSTSLPPGVTHTPTPTVTPSATPSVTPSLTPTKTPSTTPSISKTPTTSVTPSSTPSISRTATPTPTPSPSVDCSQLGIFSQMQTAALQFMQTSVGYYKINLSQTKKNIYGESLEKWYYQPFLIKSTIERSADVVKDEMFGPDVIKSIKLTIPRVAWDEGFTGQIEGKNLLPEIGDIILDRSTERYYEVHNIIVNYVPIVSNINLGQTNCPQSELVTYNMECTQTRASKLNLLPYKLL